MRAVAVSSTKDTPAEALVEIADALRERGVEPRHTDGCALVFSSAHLAGDAGSLSAALSDLLSPMPFVGWVGAWAFDGMRLPEGKPGICVLVLEGVEGYARRVNQVGLGSHVGAALAACAPTGQLRLLSLPSGGLDAKNLLPALDEQAVPIVGSVCSSGSGGNAQALAAGTGESGSAAMLSIAGLRLLVGVSQGTRALGRARQVTSVEGNVVRELDGRPAFQALLEDLPRRYHDRLGRLTGHLFAGLSSEDGQAFVMRNLVGLDPRQGAVAVAGHPKRGAPFIFAARDGRAARTDLEETLHSMWAALEGRRPLAVLVFGAQARDEKLLGTTLYDVGRVEDMLGGDDDVPVVGIASAGELATIGARTQLFRYSSVVAALLPEDIP
jgi:small ligand-binding sensory domain FIST